MKYLNFKMVAIFMSLGLLAAGGCSDAKVSSDAKVNSDAKVKVVKKTKDDIKTVKDGILEYINRKITVGQAFDKYSHFSTKHWKSFESKQGNKVVEFKGEMPVTEDMRQKRTMTIQFILDDPNGFQVGYIEVANDYNDAVNRVNMTNASKIILQLIYNNEPFTDDILLAIILNQ